MLSNNVLYSYFIIIAQICLCILYCLIILDLNSLEFPFCQKKCYLLLRKLLQHKKHNYFINHFSF